MQLKRSRCRRCELEMKVERKAHVLSFLMVVAVSSCKVIKDLLSLCDMKKGKECKAGQVLEDAKYSRRCKQCRKTKLRWRATSCILAVIV